MIKIKAGTKAANKKDAYALVQRLCAGETLAEHEQHSLLLYFAPAQRASKDAFAWVASFVCKDKHDHREGLHYVYSNGERICATNGHALAGAGSDLPQGYYCPKTGNAIALDYVYPDIDRVIPAEWASIPPVLQGIDAMLDRCETIAADDRDGTMIRVIPWLDATGAEDNVHIGNKYAILAMNGGNARLTSVRSSGDPISGRTDLGGFVIMPRRK
jgi:hypothetical protein